MKLPKRQYGRMHWIIQASAVFIVILIVIATAVFMQQPEEDPALAHANARAAALASEHSPTIGDPSAPVHIVEFLDPACETCALFYPLVKQWMAEVPGKIRLTVRHVAFHEGAEYAVQAIEAARQQDLYWETLETLLATQQQWTRNHTVLPDEIFPALEGIGLDMTQLKTDMQNFDIKTRMEQDQKDAVTLKVRATPQYFVNGRELYNFGYENLAALVRDELEMAAREAQ